LASEAITVATIEGAVPALVAARDRVDQFHAMIRGRAGIGVDEWISAAAEGLLSSFAAGIRADRQAIAAAITEPCSNGQTEGQITKLKLVKRQMYGRGKLDLLRARLVGALRNVSAAPKVSQSQNWTPNNIMGKSNGGHFLVLATGARIIQAPDREAELPGVLTAASRRPPSSH